MTSLNVGNYPADIHGLLIAILDIYLLKVIVRNFNKIELQNIKNPTLRFRIHWIFLYIYIFVHFSKIIIILKYKYGPFKITSR